MKQQEDFKEQKMGHNLRRGERQSEFQRIRSGIEELWGKGDREITGQKVNLVTEPVFILCF